MLHSTFVFVGPGRDQKCTPARCLVSVWDSQVAESFLLDGDGEGHPGEGVPLHVCPGGADCGGGNWP